MDKEDRESYAHKKMIKRYGITPAEWAATPLSAQMALTMLEHEIIRQDAQLAGYQKRLAALSERDEEIATLKLEVAKLREQLGQNSRNSSRPPSSDTLDQRAKRNRKTEPSSRKRGAQPGHIGHGRNLKPTSTVDEIVEIKPINCQQCGNLLLGDDPQPMRRQVSELPIIKAQITEYRAHKLTCLVCGETNKAAWPAELPTGSFGPRAKAFVSYLTGRLAASHRDVVELMKVAFGLEMGLGSVSAIERQVSEALAGPVQTAVDYLKQQTVNYVDETSWREQNKLNWLWINASPTVTVFQVLASRSSAAAKTVIEKSSSAIITTDRYQAYNWLAISKRQICWAHLKRDFQAFVDRGGASATVGQILLAQTKVMFQLWHQVVAGTLSRADFAQAIEPIRQTVREQLEAGTNLQHDQTRHTCANILQLESALWTFVSVPGVEPTNNNAERPLRRAVLWRKKSFGTQSQAGSQFVARMLTTLTSLRQQGRDLLDYLTAVLTPSQINNSSICLLPSA